MTSKLETQQIIQGYHACRTRGEVERMATFLSGDVEFRSPMMQFSNANDLVASSVSFKSVVLAYRMISELYDEGEGTLLYDLETATPVGVQRTAEHFRVQDGKITSILLIFDATKWRTILGTITNISPYRVP
jgi:glutamyl-tRNA reductase